MYLNQKNTTILLVGNNCTENDTIQKIIENEMNIKTSIVKNVEETLYLLKNNSIHPNIIFSDNDNMDGYDLCKQIKKLYPYIPVIAITKYNNKNLDKIFESGAMDFIYKPFNNIEIKKRIENVLKIKNIDSEIQKVSFLDKLTGLINREPFIDLLEQKISLCKRNNEKFALLFMDIDNFKTVNDVYGHNMGDKLLKQLGIKLKKNLRCGDILGRFGGDEFILCANRINNIDEITTIANKIIDIFKEKILIDNIIINVGVSIGIAIYPNDATNVIDLMKNSDLAMYKSKSKRSNNFYIYNKKLEKKLMFEYALNQALEKNEFKIYYQVIVDNKEKGCFIESLLRWESPELGIISPNDFIYILERNKSIIEVGEWVFRESCLKLIDFNLKNKQKSKISINISQIQLEDEFFIERVEKIIRETKINPKYIILEITEDLQIKNFNKIYQVLENLRKLKIGHIALDDFGSGYSSFSNLIKFPIDIVKIDKFFIDKFDDKKYINIVRTLIELIKKNNLSVVSEGIETELQYNLLREMGCDYFQGFYFSKPNENIIHLKGKQKMDKIIKQNCWQYHYDKCNSDFSKCPCPAKNAKYLNEINEYVVEKINSTQEPIKLDKNMLFPDAYKLTLSIKDLTPNNFNVFLEPLTEGDKVSIGTGNMITHAMLEENIAFTQKLTSNGETLDEEEKRITREKKEKIAQDKANKIKNENNSAGAEYLKSTLKNKSKEFANIYQNATTHTKSFDTTGMKTISKQELQKSDYAKRCSVVDKLMANQQTDKNGVISKIEQKKSWYDPTGWF